MDQKNFIVEIIEGGEGKRTYIVRTLPSVPNEPARPVAVCDNVDELAQFFDNVKVK